MLVSRGYVKGCVINAKVSWYGMKCCDLPNGGSFVRHEEGGQSQHLHDAVTGCPLPRTRPSPLVTPVAAIMVVVVMVVAWRKDDKEGGWVGWIEWMVR